MNYDPVVHFLRIFRLNENVPADVYDGLYIERKLTVAAYSCLDLVHFVKWKNSNNEFTFRVDSVAVAVALAIKFGEFAKEQTFTKCVELADSSEDMTYFIDDVEDDGLDWLFMYRDSLWPKRVCTIFKRWDMDKVEDILSEFPRILWNPEFTCDRCGTQELVDDGQLYHCLDCFTGVHVHEEYDSFELCKQCGDAGYAQHLGTQMRQGNGIALCLAAGSV